MFILLSYIINISVFHKDFHIKKLVDSILFFFTIIYLYMDQKSKNVKISEKHHTILKDYCDKNGLKIYRVIEKWIDDLPITNLKVKKRDIYGED